MALELSYYTETEYRASTVALRLQLGRSGCHCLMARRAVTPSHKVWWASLTQLLDVVQIGRWHAVSLSAAGRCVRLVRGI